MQMCCYFTTGPADDGGIHCWVGYHWLDTALTDALWDTLSGLHSEYRCLLRIQTPQQNGVAPIWSVGGDIGHSQTHQTYGTVFLLFVCLVTGKWNSWTMCMLYSSSDIFQGRWNQNEGWCVAWILELWSDLVFPDWRHTAILNWVINEGTTTEELDECKMLLWDRTLGADVLVSSVLQKQTG